MSVYGQVLVSVIVPLLNEEENVRPLYERLRRSLSFLSHESEIILVDDGSTDATLEKLREVAGADSSVKLVPLSQNLGQHGAILEGFRRSRGDILVTLDGDLQNPPEEIPKLVEKLTEGFDVVAGWRMARKDSRPRLLVSLVLNLFASLATGVKMRDYGCMLRAYRRCILESVSRYGRHTPFIPTFVTSMRAKTCEVPVGHERRMRGKSKYGLAALLFLYLNLMLDFTHIKMGFRPRNKRGFEPTIAFFGYGLVGHACLEFLLRMGNDVVYVVTHADDPEEDMWFPSVRHLAARSEIPVVSPENASDPLLAGTLQKLKPDLILSVFYRQILPKEVLEIPRLGAVNLHPSILPKYRGRCPLNWAIISGEKRTGVTLHYMTERPDSGDIIGQIQFEIEGDDNIRTVYEKTVDASRRILRRFLPAILEGTAVRIPQDDSEASYYGRRTPEDGRIDWEKDAEEIRNMIRGVTHPFPGAFSFLRGKKLLIWEALVSDRSGMPGAIMGTENGSFLVGTGRGSLILKRVQVEGEDETDGGAVLNMLGVKPGDRLER
ncbi:MAG: formyltransferase [bacterium]